VRNHVPQPARRQQRASQAPAPAPVDELLREPDPAALPPDADDHEAEPRRESNGYHQDYRDVTEDPEEPPPGALETDHVQ